ncbi:MAG: peptidase S8/S53 subtilisin kexin sedolisin, partial [Bacillota bacterium]
FGSRSKWGRYLTLAGTVLVAVVLVAATLVPATALAAPTKTRYLVGFRGQPDVGLVRAFGGEIIHSYRIVPALAVRLPDAAAAALAANPRVAYVDEDGIMHAIGDTLPWGVDRIDADVVQAGGNSGSGVKVGILDTGIDLDHPDLHVAGGATFVDGTSAPDDDNGHGTHVAGTVAALANGTGVIGVAPAAALYAVKVLDSGGSGYISDIVAGIDWAVTNGMKVINMSFGGSSDDATLRAACDNAYAAGVLLVAAAGNSGNPAGKGDNVSYPARYSSVIAVAATDQSDKRASFSSTGPDVELAAPGVDILSTYYGGGYATASGTSMACPHVVGVAALVYYANAGYSNADVRNAMTSTAIDLGTAGRDTLYGYGLVYAPDAVGGGSSPPPSSGSLAVTVTTDKSSYVMGETVTITVTVVDENGAAVGDASVHLDIVTASGKTRTADGTTGTDGTAVFSYKTKVPDGKGTYTVTATASKSGYTSASATTSFTVQ